ncbi:MAG: metallophosphoesterase [Geminicoccaceae bacterium]|nr:MAG: metallophosphoesterase [Geminicoccaceae bacterium]
MSDVFRLAHLSDVHLGPLPRPRLRELASKRATGFLSWQLRRRRAHLSTVLEATVAALAAARPDHWVITGDLVNISLPGEFERARRWLERLAPPERITLIPGNHDAYVAGAAEAFWPLWRCWMEGVAGPDAFPFLRRVGPLLFVGLSSAVPRPWGDAAGRLGRAQLARLDGHLGEAARAGLCRVVLVHHPPVEGWSPSRKALLDAEDLRAVLAREGAELVLSGHDHRLEVGTLDGPAGPVPVVAAPSASLRADEPDRRGGGLLYRIAPLGADGRFRIEAEAVRVEPDGRVVRESVALPGAAVAALA